MLRDFKFLPRNNGKNEEPENVPVNSKDISAIRSSVEPPRAPLISIQDFTLNPKPEPEGSIQSKVNRTPTKPKPKIPDSTYPLRTPDEHGGGFLAKHRFGWTQKNESNLAAADLREDMGNYSTHVSRVGGTGIGGLVNLTPKITRTVGRAGPGYSESNYTQSTPTKSVSKPPNSAFRSKVDGSVGSRAGNFVALYKGMPISGAPSTVVNTVEVSHFDLKEDPSFWMDHNVQVLIRVRPLNSMERSTHGYNRCLKQESSQSITWIGQPETRFTFDHVACESVDQEMLFRMAVLPMVENCLSGYNSCIFAYGQTGSGKTYTMLGEIENLKLKPSPHRGMTPRIFEFLFARIQAEEESRREEKLKYNCKCSFLEIYNEQITDLLDPSSTNLLLREDVKKSVYVENLSKFEVQTVSDILSLISQGSSNRKVAATNLNRESSRSHSVFTCVIESRWEKDSTTNLRFARLNLVDLAGSERQKTSGAEGERLKEAANINKSLSTLGHAIMVLVDVANGKPRHVPYRDSRLTFLLQDSLGGNSKTMIVANVSPSIGCASETLNTLKFAQRAKMIQNNAMVNEDSNGDVTALQHQIQLLKEELSILKCQNVSRFLSFGSFMEERRQAQENSCAGITCEMDMPQVDEILGNESKDSVRRSSKQLKTMVNQLKFVETTLAGALRREQMAETSIKQLEAEIEQLNRLVRQREEDSRCTKMMLRFRDDKIQRMESILRGSIPAETYLLEENRAFSEEILLLQTKLDKNPEVTRFAMENIRLLDQLRRFQEFYEEGEREILLSEVSQLRAQLLQFLEGNSKPHDDSKFTKEPQEAMHIRKENDSLSLELENILSDLEECRRNLSSCLDENATLSRELEDVRSLLNNLETAAIHENYAMDSLRGPNLDVQEQKVVQDREIQQKHKSMLTKHEEKIVNLQLELDILKIILKEERSFAGKTEERVMCLNRDLEQSRNEYSLMRKQYEDAESDLEKAKSVIEAIESQQILSINEIDDLRNSNNHYVQLLNKKETEIMSLNERFTFKELKELSPSIGSENGPLGEKMERIQDSLEKAKKMNTWYQCVWECQVSNDEERDEICWRAEAETVEVIVCLQEELTIVQQQLQDNHLREQESNHKMILLQRELKEVRENLFIRSNDNESLREKLEEKDAELTNLSEEWALLTNEIEEVLADGCEILNEASDQLDLISGSFPQRRIWISEHVGKMVQTISEKELLIEDLRRCLEDANNKRSDVEFMLKSLRGAALAITEAHQHECTEKEKEILFLTSELSARASTIGKLEDKIRLLENQIGKTSICATVAFVIVNRLSEENDSILNALKQKNILLNESIEINFRKDGVLHEQAAAMKESEKHILKLKAELAECMLNCAYLREKLSEEEEHTRAMKQKLENFEESSILNAKEKLVELKTGVSTLKSCLSAYVGNSRSPDGNKSQEIQEYFDEADADADAGQIATEKCEDANADKTFSEELRTDVRQCSPCDMDDLKPRRPYQDVCDRDATILLLKKEIGSALESLKEVQAEMDMLREEKKQKWYTEQQNQQSMKYMMTQLLNLQELMNYFENQTQIKMEAFVRKMEELEQVVLDAGSHLFQSKELIELEVHDAKFAAAQKATEVTCVVSKFAEAQDSLKEADDVINGLLLANEALKLEGKKLEKMSATLTNDRDLLTSEFQSLQYVYSLNNQQIEHLGFDLTETKALTLELEGMIAEVQNTFEENYMILASDLCSMRSLIFDSSKLVHLWLEDIWSGIIVKDCAVSVLHLCHMGVLLETARGLNAENGLLQHGIQSTNDVIGDLREHNINSRKKLDMCRVIEGKLLADIKNNFDRVSRNEKENHDLGAKLSTFEKKILNLQLQEEMMLQRSNDMTSQLAILIKEWDLGNKNFVTSLLDQEKLLKDKVEFLQSRTELVMANWCLKDFESLILASELEEMALHNAESERKFISCCAVLEDLKREIVLCKVDAELKEQFSANTKVEVGYHISDLAQQNKKLQKDINKLKTLLQACNNDLETKGVQLTRMNDLEKDNESVRTELRKLTTENSLILLNLEVKNSDFESSLNRLYVIEKENCRLEDEVLSMQNCVANLRMNLEVKNAQVQNLEESQFAMLEEMHFKTHSNSVNKLKEDNALLREELMSLKKSKNESLSILCSNVQDYVDFMDKKLSNSMSREVFMVADKIFPGICETIERTSYFMEELECLQSHANELLSENRCLQTEIKRKDDVLKGLLFDLSLLQESTSNTKCHKDEIEELISSLETLEDELALKSRELNEATATIQMLEAELRDKTRMISDLGLNISKERESCNYLSRQDQELRIQLQDALTAKSNVDEELTEKKKINEGLEMEIFEMGNTLDQMKDLIESLKSNLSETACEKDHLRIKVVALEKKLETEETRVEENEAKVRETQQIAEMRKLYAEEKQEEVILLEKSIQELECTINVLESEVNIVKGDADRQRLQREELELELRTVKHQMQNVKNAESEFKSYLDEKDKYLHEAQERIQILERDIVEKDAELVQFKAHISELNLHAEAQTCEYKQKFKVSDAMAEQVKSEGHSSNITNSSSNKLEKCATKPRGSGSPFKCIGLGMAQQIKSERDEELVAARVRIEEFESLAVSRQKEIFTLNSKLAAAESMTHDVIRDLLGVKLDMTTYVSLLDNQQVRKITDNAQLHNLKSDEVQGVSNVEKQLNEFIEERQGWLEEIDRKQAEITAAELTLEKLQQEEQLLKTENEMLKEENMNQKTKVMQLEGEVSKLSGQQNLQQRIHHHAKIKEENNMLKIENEDLSYRLKRKEVILSSVKEELARFRSSIGKTHIDFDEEKRLSTKLMVSTREER